MTPGTGDFVHEFTNGYRVDVAPSVFRSASIVLRPVAALVADAGWQLDGTGNLNNG
jgi:hypothetical protein